MSAFKNLDGSGPPPLGQVLQWAVGERLTGKKQKSPRHAPVRFVEPDPRVLATPPGPGEGARLTWLGHASWLVQLDGLSLLVDPVLSERIGLVIRRNVPSVVPVERLPPISASLVSHNHHDHMDLPTLLRVGAPVVAGLGMSGYFRRSRLGCTELDWWQSTKVGPVTVHFVPAQHWSRRTPKDTNHTLWGGFVVEGSSARLYHAGDTAYFEGFREIGQRFPHLDAAMLPIGAYAPAWFMVTQHMNPEEAARSFEDLGARRFLAMHWGTYKLTDEPLDEPPLRLEAERKRRGWSPERVRVLAVGESLSCSSPSV